MYQGAKVLHRGVERILVGIGVERWEPSQLRVQDRGDVLGGGQLGGPEHRHVRRIPPQAPGDEQDTGHVRHTVPNAAVAHLCSRPAAVGLDRTSTLHAWLPGTPAG